MPNTIGTRPLSWYAEMAPDYLEGEENQKREDDEAKEQHKDYYIDYLLERRRR